MEGESEVRSREMERHIVAAAEHILMALKESSNLAGDARKAISDIQSCLLAEPTFRERREGFLIETEERLKRSEKVIMNWEANRPIVSDSGPAERNEYLEAVVEIQRSIGSLGNSVPFRILKQKEILFRANCALEIAMSRLKEEVKRVLGSHKQTYEPWSMSLPSHMANLAYDESFTPIEDNSVDLHRQGVNEAVSTKECAVDMVRSDMIPVLKSIAKVMFDSDHGQEFCRVFISARQDALHEYSTGLELKQLSIEEILSLNWDVLSHEITNWVQAMKVVTGFYLPSEQNLCNEILAEFGEISSITFLNIAKSSILLLLNFGKAIVMSSHRPEKLFGVLDMYEVLADLLINIDALFSEEECSFIRIDFHNLLPALGVYAWATFSEFRNSIESNRSQKPFTKGSVHPLNSYAMNYIKTLCAYRATLEVLFCNEQDCFMCPSLAAENMADNPLCPLEHHLRPILPVLEANLIEKSTLLKQNALRHIFLMNNICYMVDKVKESDDLRLCLGDEWIRKQIVKYEQHAMSYLRATWSCALKIIRESGYSSTSNPRTNTREKCRAFCIAFEEVYKFQTGWVVPNPRLRSDLQISTSQKVITGYRTFLGLHKSDIDVKHIKYTADDLENLVLDFFGGSNKSLPRYNLRRK